MRTPCSPVKCRERSQHTRPYLHVHTKKRYTRSDFLLTTIHKLAYKTTIMWKWKNFYHYKKNLQVRSATLSRFKLVPSWIIHAFMDEHYSKSTFSTIKVGSSLRLMMSTEFFFLLLQSQIFFPNEKTLVNRWSFDRAPNCLFWLIRRKKGLRCSGIILQTNDF